jgi:hypothetical protein
MINHNLVCIDNKYYYKITPLLAVKKQEKWRRQQIKILYDTGRPIFGKYKEDFR